mmetsp:Transcript_19909/g.61615  ORF Transcript_19909/g.61615 Transcript_19909/m.61615 type:complete len:187 (-) Transcript_19909:110-670(-)
MRVAGRGSHFEDARVNRQQSHVERASAQVEHEDVLFFVGSGFLETVRDRRSGRLVDDASHLQAGDRARVFRRLSLRVVKVRRHRHHRVLDLLPQKGFGRFLHLRQHHRRNLLGSHLLPIVLADAQLNPRSPVARRDDAEGPVLHVRLNRGIREFPPDQTFRVVNGRRRIRRRLILGRVSDQPRPVR